MSFEKFGLSQELQTAIKNMGITVPTEIQEKSIQSIIEGKDVIGESATGSGKTLAFGSGIIQHTIPKQGLQCLVLAPTRELAEQVKGTLVKLSSVKHLNIVSVYGGVSINPQIRDIARADVVVATPGRLLDHLERRTINLSKVKILVLDEADRMLDMGFIDDIEKIIRVCPQQRQTLFFSATLSQDIKRLSSKYMNNPLKVSAKIHVDPSKLKQVYYAIPKHGKLSLLAHLLKNENSKLVMVFCNTRHTTDFVVRTLRSNGVEATAIHGGLSQNKRSSTLSMFNKGKVNVLVCTDVAARGLHIDNVSHIYNYEIPRDPKEYVHRVGRTARAGEEGKVVNLLSEADHDNFSKVLDHTRFNIQNTPIPEFQKITVVRDEGRENKQFRDRYNQRHGGRRPFREERSESFGRRDSRSDRGFGRSEDRRGFGRRSEGGYGRSDNRGFGRSNDFGSRSEGRSDAKPTGSGGFAKREGGYRSEGRNSGRSEGFTKSYGRNDSFGRSDERPKRDRFGKNDRFRSRD